MIPQPWYRKERKAWYVEISGRQVRLAKTKKAALAKYKEILQQHGLSDGPSRTKLHDLIDEYWAWYERENSEKTVESRRYLLQTFRDQTANMLAEELKPLHVDKWIRRSGAEAPASIAGRINHISGMFNWGIRMGLITVNPISKMPRPTALPAEDFVLSSKYPALLKACEARELRDLVSFMLETGCRPTEVFRLEAAHFDSNRFVLPIIESKGRRRQRVIYLTSKSRAIAERLCKKWEIGPIFRNTRGVAWNKSSVNCALSRVKNKLGWKKLYATMFRHSFAHFRLTMGQSPEIVAKLMGHVDTTMLMKRYGHLAEATDLLANEADKFSLPEPKANEQDDSEAA